MATYKFNFQQADVVRDDMAAITKNIQNMLTDLDSQVRGSLQEWTSDARESYDASKLKWDAAAAKMPEALGRAEMALAEISNGYLQVEHTGAGMWGRGA
ncbi:MAG: hypothetical protein QOI21_3096 [Actinomycetota bacterium]|jgi:WXG100 family type VII secretion target|nr:hypothetical protein [Actinomycetota bacterium]